MADEEKGGEVTGIGSGRSSRRAPAQTEPGMPSPREVFEIAHNAFLSLDSEGRVVYANPQAEQLLGYDTGKLVGVDLAGELVINGQRELVGEALRALITKEDGGQIRWRLAVQVLHADTRELPVEMSATAVRGAGGWLVHIWLQDVSERIELLQELGVHLRGEGPGMAQILDSLAEAVTIRDRHHHILYANDAAVRQMGFASLEEMQRRPLQSIFDEYIVQDEEGEELKMSDIPSVRLLEGEGPQPLVMRTVNRVTG